MNPADFAASFERAAADAPASASEFSARMADWVAPALPVDPGARWLLTALHRHVPRQRWLGRTVSERLGASLGRVGAWGAFEHPSQVPSAGEMPGLPEWSYRFHGIGCCLTHRDGTTLDVDFVEGSPDWIDGFFYREYLGSLPQADAIEARLCRPEPTTGYWFADFPTLTEAGLVEGGHRVRLTELGHAWGQCLEEAATRIMTSSPGPEAAWMALAFGDPHLAQARLDAPAPEPLRRAVREQNALRRITMIAGLEGGSSFYQACLRSLVDLGRREAEPIVVKQLEREPIDGVVSAALDLIEDWADPQHRTALCQLLARSRGESGVEPHVRGRVASMLMRHGPRALDDATRGVLIEALERPGGTRQGLGGLLLCLLGRDSGLTRLRAGLRSESAATRFDAAAALGVLATDDAMAELRGCETIEAQTVLGRLRGLAPIAGPQPLGHVVQWRGQSRRVFELRELMASRAGEDTAAWFEQFVEAHGALLQVWRAH
ncbi:MAG: hypothetical protein AAF799_08370 [Myxococcota bacterium]